MSDARSQRSEEERHILTMVRWLLYLVFVVVGFLILRVLGPVLTPLLAAAAVAYLLDGAVDRLTSRGLNRTAVVGGLLFGFIALIATILILIVPLVSDEIRRFVVALPGLVERATVWLAEDFGVEVPSDWKAYLKGEEFRSFLESAVGPLSKAAAAALGGVFGFLGWLAELLLVPVFAFYFLVDWDHIVARVHAFAPPRHRARIAEIAREIDGAVSSWIRGQLIVMAILAALYATAFKIIGLHLGITVGILVGLLTVIPFLGTFVGAGLALLMLVLDWQGPGQLAQVGVVFVVFHLLEAAVLTPRLVGKRVGLGEVGALFAVLAGGQLLGFAGVLLAVPIAASVAVLIRRAVRFYEGSSFFTVGSELVVDGVVIPAGTQPPPRRTRSVSTSPPPLSDRPELDPLARVERDTTPVPELELDLDPRRPASDTVPAPLPPDDDQEKS
jgi:predicted PurR-regulated permease PerM